MSEESTIKWEIGNPTQKLPLTSEYIFKKIFAKEENHTILEDLLEAILERRIRKAIVLNPEIPKDLLDSKMGILDLKVQLENNEMIDIELEMKDILNIKEKGHTILRQLISEQLNSKYDYTEKKKIITIHLYNFNFFQRNSYHSIAKMKFEKSTNKAFVNMGYEKEDEFATDMIEMHFIELPKFIQKEPKCETKLEQWMWLFAGNSEEKLKEAMDKNNKIAKTVKELEELSKNSEEKQLYQCRKKAEWEYIETIDYFTRKRIKEGMDKGERKGKIEIARRLLKENIAEEIIRKVTKLSIDEIKKLSIDEKVDMI